MSEPRMTINGHLLTDGQVMTLRVALSTFVMELEKTNALGADETGKAIRKGYLDRSAELIQLMKEDL